MIKRAAIIGAGVIGAGWAARLLYNGAAVSVFDPAPDAEQNLKEVLANADAAMENLITAPPPARGELTIAKTAAEAAANAQWIIESVPENTARKHEAYSAIEKAAPRDALITSSTSGILPTQLQKTMHNPRRFAVAHPFNPVYLLPLVEIVGGEQTSAQTIEQAAQYCKFVGMHALVVKKEIPAFVADRLLEAVWRESLWLVKDGIATTQEIDDAVRMGFGLRWAQMGVFETYRAGGGKGGMRHFLAQFAPALKWHWSKLMDVPEMDDNLINKIAQQSDEQSGALTMRELEQLRDGNLTAILRALRARNTGAGKTIADYELRLHNESPPPQTKEGELVRTFSRVIPDEWKDHNGHMNESRYLECFTEASDELMRVMGADMNYIRNGKSYFTAETHIRHLDEARAGQRVAADTQVLKAGKKLHLFHFLRRIEKDKQPRLLATGEHLLLHVDLKTRRVCDPSGEVLRKGEELTKMHSSLPRPQGAGRAVGDKP